MTIKELRLMKGLTQTEFAKAIGIGMSTLTGYEAGKREPGAKALAAIKEVYGCDLNDTLSTAVDAPAAAPTSAPVEAAPAEKKTHKPRAKKEAVAPAPAEEKVEKKARKPRAKKEAVTAPTPAEEKAEVKVVKKPEKKAKKTASIIIQSAMGGEITPEEILSRVGDVDKVYVRPDQNAIYWVKGEETGAINIW